MITCTASVGRRTPGDMTISATTGRELGVTRTAAVTGPPVQLEMSAGSVLPATDQHRRDQQHQQGGGDNRDTPVPRT